MPGTASNPLSPGASPAAPPSRGEIERKLSMRSAEPPRPRRRSSNPGPPSVVQSGNESDSSFQSSLAGPGPITATSPITGSPTHNSLTAAGINTNTIPNTHNSVNANQFPNANPGTTTVGSVGGSNLSIPPKGGSSVLSSIQERGERPDPSSRPYGSAIGGSDHNYNNNHNHNTEYDYYDLEEVEEDEDLGETELELDPEDDDDPENVPGGRTKVDGEELKRGMEGERVIKSGYLMKKGEKRKNWKKRWFVLRTEKLAYYRDEKEYMLCQILSLRDIHSVVTVQLKKHNYAFGIVTAKRTFYVRATSQGEMEGWVHSVNDARRNLAEGDEKARSPPNVGSNAGQGSSNINIPVPAGSTSMSQMLNRGAGVGMSESSGLYGVSPGYTEMSLGSYTPQRGGSVSHSLGGGAAYGSQPQTPSGLYQAQMQVQQPGIESQLDRLAVIDHAATPTASDRSRGMPDSRTTSAHRDPSTSSVSSLPVEPGTTPFGSHAGYNNNNSQHNSLAPAFVPTSSDEEDDAFVPRSLGQSSHLAGMMSMSPTTQLSPMGHLPFPAGPSASHPVPVQTDPKKVILNGYLMKLGTRGKKTWRKRWFVLTSGELVYTKSHMDTKVHRQIPLSSILDAIEFEPVEPLGSDDTDSDSALDQARSPTSPRKPRHLHRERHHTGSKSRREDAAVRHAFQVITPQRTFRLSAPSEEEEIKWVAALRALINRERGLMSPTMAMGTTGGLAPALPNVLSPASGYGQAGQGMGTGVRGHVSQAATPNAQGGGGDEGSYFGLSPVLGNHSHTPSVPATPIGGFSNPVHQTQMGSTTPTSSSQQGQVQGQQARSPASRSSLPPLITTPSHARTRSATQSAKAAVAEVVRRFNPESNAG